MADQTPSETPAAAGTQTLPDRTQNPADNQAGEPAGESKNAAKKAAKQAKLAAEKAAKAAGLVKKEPKKPKEPKANAGGAKKDNKKDKDRKKTSKIMFMPAGGGSTFTLEGDSDTIAAYLASQTEKLSPSTKEEFAVLVSDIIPSTGTL